MYGAWIEGSAAVLRPSRILLDACHWHGLVRSIVPSSPRRLCKRRERGALSNGDPYVAVVPNKLSP